MMLALLTVMIAGFSLTRGDAELRVDRPRPVLAAIRILEERYGWITNYEDPPYTNAADVVELNPTFTGSRKIGEPRSGRIEIGYPVLAETGRPESQAAILQMVIDDHARRENAGRFKIRVVGGMHCIVPAQGSILDVPVTLAPKPRTLEEAAEEIVAAVGRATGVRFRAPVVSRASPAHSRISASGEPASGVLLRLFSELEGGPYSWSLLYIPESGFELNIQGKQ